MIQMAGNQPNIAIDSRSLDSLRLQARQSPDQAAKAAAQQFEAIFLQTLLKSMRDASPQDGPMDSEQTKMYTTMLDQQLAQSLSSKGMGLADVMLRQLMRNRAAVTGVEGVPPTDQMPAGVRGAMPVPGTAAVTAGAAATRAGTEDFLRQMKEHAVEASTATGIPARFLLGHAALESGWGKNEIRKADGGQSFNLFGIKAGRNWNGPTVDAMTTEYVGGVPRKMVQKFRAYTSYAESFQDYARLLRGNPRYADVLKQGDSAGFAQGLQRAGYATDPQYADKLTRVINSTRLRQTLLA